MSTSVFPSERSPRLLHTEETLAPLRRTYFSDLIETLFHQDLDPECRPILFTSTTTGAGVSFACSSIATELASLGGKVLLADAQTLVRLARRPGRDAVTQSRHIDSSRLWVLGPGQMEAGDQGDPSSVASVLTALREEFMHIIVDAPALSISGDAITLAAAVFGTVLVAQSGSTATQEVVRARQKFISLGGRVLGSIYNGRSAEFAGSSK